MISQDDDFEDLGDQLGSMIGGDVTGEFREFRAPGRVNLMGDHTDYNEGLVMPMAIDYETRIAVVESPSTRIRSLSEVGDAVIETKTGGFDGPPWAAYPAGVISELKKAGHKTAEMTGVVASTIPTGRGLSSSAALEVSIALAATSLAGLSIDRLELAEICRRAEEVVVGVECGIMDQAISLLGIEGSALIIDCSTVVARPVPIPAWIGVIAIDSGVERSLTGSQYNTRRQECRDALEMVRARGHQIDSLSEITVDDFDQVAATLPPVLVARIRHVISENGRVRELASIFGAESISPTPGADGVESIRALLAESQRSLVDDYGAGHPNTNKLVELAEGVDGCFGARQTGAGWGGSVVAFAIAERAEEIASEICNKYKDATSTAARALVCHPAPGASELNAASDGAGSVDHADGEPRLGPEA